MNKEQIEELTAFCDKHFIRKCFGCHYDNKKAAAIGSAIGHNGSYLSQYEGKDGENIIYSGGKELLLFTK